MKLTRAYFHEHAHPLILAFPDHTHAFELTPRQSNNTGSLLWNCSRKIQYKLGDLWLPCQVGLNVTIMGSKEVQ